MKSTVIAIAASLLLAGADARSFRRNAHAEAHARLEKRGGYEAPEAETCKVVTLTTWVPYTAPAPTTTEYIQSTVYVKPTPTTTPCPVSTVPVTYGYPVPTPDVTTCPTPGTYTFPAKTITLTSTEYVCVPTSTVVPPGTHTYGYTTTVVATETTVTCPYATTYTSSSAVYTTLTSTILYCPAAGTHTYGGYTTTVTKTATLSYPTVTSYAPGTYTHPVSTVTVTATDVVYTCPYSPYVTPAYVAPASSYVAPAPKPTTYAPAPAPKPITYAPAPKPSTHAPAPKPTTSSTPSYGDVGAGKQWCITYTQYNDDKSCKSSSQIDSDMAEIAAKGFKSVRIYAPDCDALEAISSACETHGLKIVMGVFLRKEDQASGWSDAYSQVATLTTWGKWSLVELIVIGNEAVFGGIISSSELSGLINSCRGKFQAAGYTGPITTSEVVSTLQANPGLCSCIDVVAVNIQPFFNGGYAADAGTFLKSQMQLASDVCGKKTYCLEAGWPSAGSPMNNAVPGTAEQKQALEAIYSVDEGYIAYYTTYNDGWKDAGMNGGVEQHFGCSNLFPLGGSY